MLGRILRHIRYFFLMIKRAIYITELKGFYRDRFKIQDGQLFEEHFRVYFDDSSSSLNIGKEVFFRDYCSVICWKDGTIDIGNNVFFNHGCSLNSLCSIMIGHNCLFGENVKVYDHDHRFREALTSRIQSQGYKSSPVSIGKNCWLGSNVIILRGVTIGDNCVIGANCTIERDIPSGSVVKMGIQSLHISKIIS